MTGVVQSNVSGTGSSEERRLNRRNGRPLHQLRTKTRKTDFSRIIWLALACRQTSSEKAFGVEIQGEWGSKKEKRRHFAALRHPMSKSAGPQTSYTIRDVSFFTFFVP